MNGPIQERIRAALPGPADRDFAAAAIDLLAVLGYRSSRAIAGQSGNPAEFFRQFYAPNPDTKSEGDFLGEAESVHLLFQLTNAEIAGTEQAGLFEADRFDTGNAQSFLFAAVALGGQTYPRGRYAAFTRELNKRLIHPMVVLFRTAAGKISLAFVHRRRNRQHPERAVLGPVSLLREINPVQPHRAHLDILADLALPERRRWLESHGHSPNFDGLLAAWLDALDTEELNRRFYRDLFAWFEGAVQTARFPAGLAAEEQVIRLITRMLFCWFIKEKGLAAEELFIEHQVRGLLKNYDRESGDSYYRAVLQNLFFATLNTEIERRRFSGGGQATHRDFSRYRYAAEIAAPERLLELFSQTPFINGGLFDCLDSEQAANQGGQRIDCFTDNVINPRRAEYGLLSLPNRLFFGDAAAPGLLDLFHRYQFTVEENTPAEQEVALDPELLGKVFENLLAAVNPETRQTARKETGSYYTPRPVVDYMATAALVNALAGQVAANAAPAAASNSDSWQNRLHWLLDYNDAFADAEHLFTPAERESLIRAIAGLKVLDPAVGSGAFPMGILHQLTLALRRLDPDNALWEGIQKEIAGQQAAAAFDTADPTARNDRLAAVSATFDRYRNSDYGRKLYLIQNGIYGVDVQPLAVQIAKLRFFISLAIEQQPNADRTQNYGIAPLPNLETRFVAADALRGLGGLHRELVSPAAAQGQRRLAENRERHFHAANRRDKLACRREDARLRRQLAASLRKVGLPAGPADRIARWDPYNPSAAADWFDPGYMFGVAGGFDVVLGNPPYVPLQRNGSRLANRYQDAGFATFARSGDLYQLFYERGAQLLKPHSGLLAYITSNSWLKAEYGKATRRYFAAQHTPLLLLEMGKDVFEQAIVDASILIVRQGKSAAIGAAVDLDKRADKTFPPAPELWGELRPEGDKPWSALSSLERSVMDKMAAAGPPLKDWDVALYFGIKTGYDRAFIIDGSTREWLIAADPKSAGIIKPILRGRDIRRYQAEWAGQWLIETHNGYGDVSAVKIDDYPAVKTYLDGFYERLAKRQDKGRTPYNLRSCRYHGDFAREKLFWADMSAVGRFAYSDQEIYCNGKGYIMTGESLKYLCAVLNSSLMAWYVQNTATTTGMGLTEWKIVTVERLPIPQISAAAQKPLVALVDRILAAKAADPGAVTAAWEGELDGLVYGLYGLSGEEVGVVEG